MHLTPPLIRRLVGGVLLCAGARASQAQAPDGVTSYPTSRFSVTLAIPSVRDVASERRRLGLLMTGCSEVLDIAPVDSAALVTRERLPVVVPDRLRDVGVVEVTVTPRPEFPVECADMVEAAGLLEDRAQWISFDSLVSPSQRIRAVRVSIGDRELAPIAVESVVMRRLGPAGYAAVSGTAMRLSFRIDDLAPSSVGEAPSLVIRVSAMKGATADSVVLSWSAVRALWDATLGVRASTLTAQSPPLILPAPTDSMLQQAHAAYATGAMSVAARVAHKRLSSGNLTRADVVWSRALTAVVFGAAGDSLATRVILEYLASLEPCLSWDDAAPDLVKWTTARVDRQFRRCRSTSGRRIVARSLLLPGFGRPPEYESRVIPRVLFAGALLGTAVYSQVLRSRARDKYEVYLRQQVTNEFYPRAPGLFDDARQEQARGKQLVAVALVMYVAQAGLSAFFERQMERRLDAVSSYGAPPASVGVHLDPRTSRVGVGVQWIW